MTDWQLYDGEGHAVPVLNRGKLAVLLAQYSTKREEHPFIAQLIGPPGSLGFGVGRHRTLLEHIPANGDPPYHESRGSLPAGSIVVYFFGGEWTEYDSEAEVEWIDAKRAILDFFDKGTLSSAVRWAEV